jgi:hypothetical protein
MTARKRLFEAGHSVVVINASLVYRVAVCISLPFPKRQVDLSFPSRSLTCCSHHCDLVSGPYISDMLLFFLNGGFTAVLSLLKPFRNSSLLEPVRFICSATILEYRIGQHDDLMFQQVWKQDGMMGIRR